MSTDRVHFRLIHMECCGHMFCHVNPRLPTYCPSCGKLIYPTVKSWVVNSDENATLKYDFATGSYGVD